MGKKNKKNPNLQSTSKPNSSKSSKKVKPRPQLNVPKPKPKPRTFFIIYEDSDHKILKKVEPIIIAKDKAFQITSLIVKNFKNAVKDLNVLRLSQCNGSFRDGLYFEGNHIDLIYPLRSPNYIEDPIPRRVEQSLRQSSLFENVIYTVTNQVPIIRLVHLETQKHVDISFHKDKADIMNTKLMQYYVSLDRNLTYFILYLKYLLSRYELRGANKITTTVLFWLVVFFMQQKRSFPSVLELRRAAQKQCYVSGWDCSVPSYKLGTENSGSLFVLLRDFFQFYRECNFSTIVICPLVAYSISTSQFEHLQLPYDGFSVYVGKVQNGEIAAFSTSYINLQDPTLLGNNLAKHTTESIVNRFKILCYYAYEGLSDFNRACFTKKESLTKFLPINLYIEKDHHWRSWREPSSKINNINSLETITPETFFTKRMQKRAKRNDVNWIKRNVFSGIVFKNRKQTEKRKCKPVDGFRCRSCNDDHDLKIKCECKRVKGVQCHCHDYDYFYIDTRSSTVKSENSNIPLPNHLPSNAYTAVIKLRSNPKNTMSSLSYQILNIVLRRKRINHDGGVLIQLYSKTDYDKLLQMIRDKKVYDVEEKKPLQPQIIIHHVPVDYKKIDIIEAIQIKTKIDPIHIQFTFYTGKRKSKFDKKAIVVCTPALWRKLMTAKKIYLGSKFCTIKKYLPVQRCFKCKLLGHLVKYCKETVNYSISSRCHNCSIFNQRLPGDDYSNKARDINHSIFDPNCLTYKDALAKTELLTDYVS